MPIMHLGAEPGVILGSRGQRSLLRFMGLILAALGGEVLLAAVYTLVPQS